MNQASTPELRSDAAERLAVDLLAVRQRVDELDRRVTALQLLMAADDARHVEQGIMDAATAATDLHKVTGLLGGAGLMDRLRERCDEVEDAGLVNQLAALENALDSTRARIARSAMLTSAVSSQLERQLSDVLGTPAASNTYTPPSGGPGTAPAGPRLIDRLA